MNQVYQYFYEILQEMSILNSKKWLLDCNFSKNHKISIIKPHYEFLSVLLLGIFGFLPLRFTLE